MTQIKQRLPKYQLIGETLIKGILANEYLVGTQLPTEKELCDCHNISRHTAREALKQVEKTGLVERRQGSGSTVIRNTMPEKINHFVNSVDDLMAFGNQTRFEISISNIITIDNDLAQQLQLRQGDDCIHLGGVRTDPHNNSPICFSNIYRPKHQDAVDQALQDKDTAIYAVIKALDVKKIDKIEQQISACMLPKSMQEPLNASANTPAMKITRRYFSTDDQDLILIAESIYPAERFNYSTVLYPE